MSSPFRKPARKGSDARRIEQSAADWLARQDRGLSSAEQEELSRWIDADERHARIFAQMRETWSLLDDAGDITHAAFDPEIDALPPPRRKLLRWVPVTLAAAAAVAIALTSWWRPSPPVSAFSTTAATVAGQIEKMQLPDGSWIQLNAGSAVLVNYSDSHRMVRLKQGEAHFVVARDPTRPFVVTANSVAVQALGTAFNVKLQAGDVEILVTSGNVRVDSEITPPLPGPSPHPSAASPPAFIGAGQKAIISLAVSAAESPAPAPVVIASVTLAQMEQTLAWRQQKIDFVAVSLAEIVAEFNRLNRTKLMIADAELAARNFGGSFNIDDPETLVQLLETTFGVVVERQGDEITLRPGR
jgi:transmembrane sensor